METVKAEKMLAIVVSVFAVFFVRSTVAINNSNLEPCEFRESVDISSGYIDTSGNFHHNGIVYENGTFAQYDYIYENFTNKVPVEPHFRGCICLYKTCIRLCCRESERNCKIPKSFKVPNGKGLENIEVVQGKYGVLMNIPCPSMYMLNPKAFDEDKWFFQVSVKVMMESKDIHHFGFAKKY